jgi:hypothetical protein
VAVDTDQTALPMQIRGQIVAFDTIGPGSGVVLGRRKIRGAVFPIVVVLIPTVIIAAHIVAVMTTQALFVGGSGKGVAFHLAVVEGEMAGGAPGAVGDGRIIVPGGIDMATQAPPTEQVVDQGDRGGGRGGDWNFPRRAQRIPGTEMMANLVDLVCQRIVRGLSGIRHLPGMA